MSWPVLEDFSPPPTHRAQAAKRPAADAVFSFYRLKGSPMVSLSLAPDLARAAGVTVGASVEVGLVRRGARLFVRVDPARFGDWTVWRPAKGERLIIRFRGEAGDPERAKVGAETALMDGALWVQAEMPPTISAAKTEAPNPVREPAPAPAPRAAARQARDFTARVLGDPPPGRSALDQARGS